LFIGGVPGIGKTQIGIQLACNAQTPATFGGADGHAIYIGIGTIPRLLLRYIDCHCIIIQLVPIDTEGSFLPERAQSIAQGLIDHLRSVSTYSEHVIAPIFIRLLIYSLYYLLWS
jgi:RecA/RadA recombinase